MKNSTRQSLNHPGQYKGCGKPHPPNLPIFTKGGALLLSPRTIAYLMLVPHSFNYLELFPPQGHLCRRDLLTGHNKTTPGRSSLEWVHAPPPPECSRPISGHLDADGCINAGSSPSHSTCARKLALLWGYTMGV